MVEGQKLILSLRKSTGIVTAGYVGRRFVIGAGIVVVDDLADGIVIDADDGICIVLSRLERIKDQSIIDFPHLRCRGNCRAQL